VAGARLPGIRYRRIGGGGARIDEKLEKLSVSDALRAVRFAEVVVMMMDAQNRFEEQDLRIADLIEREGRAVVLAVNKWDLMEKKGSLVSALRTDVDHWLPQIKGAPVVAVSGLMGEGIDRLMSAIEEAYAVWNKRVTHGSPQPLVRTGGRCQSATVGVGPPAKTELHHAGQGAPAELRAVFARARTRCRRLICAISPTACVRPSICPGTPGADCAAREGQSVRPQAQAAVMSQEAADRVAEMPPVRSGAAAFIFVTILLDMFALGLILPILPKLVESFVAKRTPQRRPRIFRTVRYRLGADAVHLLADPRRIVRPVRPPAGGAVVEFRAGARLCADGAGAVADVVFIGRVISGITSASISTAFAYIADVTPPDRRAAVFGRIGAGVRRRIHSRAGRGRAARRHGSASAVLGRGGPELHQCGVRLADPPRNRCRRSGARHSAGRAPTRWAPCGCCAPTGFSPGCRWRISLAQVAHVSLALDLRALRGLPLRLGHQDRRLDAGAGRRRRHGGARRSRRSDRQAPRRTPGAVARGWGCGALGFFIYGAAPTGPLFWLGIPVMSLWGIAGAAIQALTTQMVAPDQQGQLQGATNSVQSVSQLIGPVSCSR